MKLIAHRGASAECPENTMKAFECTLAIGVDAIEMDLLMTKDGHLVVRHDDLIRVGREWRYVHELTWEDLQKIDVGEGERVPSLKEVFDRFYGRIPLFLDLKSYGLAPILSKFLSGRKATERVHVTSFLHSEISEMGRLYPNVGRSIIFTALPIPFENHFHEASVQEVSLHRAYLTEAVVRKLREKGISVRVYTVNLPREGERFASWGVEAIFTDDPAAMQFLRGG